MKAISNVFDPERRDWDPAVDLMGHLKSEVNGIISSLRKTKSRTNERLVDWTEEAAHTHATSDDRIILRIGASRVLDGIFQKALDASDELAQLVLMEALSDLIKPQEVAAKLERKVSQINEARRRLRGYLKVVLRRKEDSDG
jgi:DNA-directed RNA polymerase specialized sigma24 family protein